MTPPPVESAEELDRLTTSIVSLFYGPHSLYRDALGFCEKEDAVRERIKTYMTAVSEAARREEREKLAKPHSDAEFIYACMFCGIEIGHCLVASCKKDAARLGLELVESVETEHIFNWGKQTAAIREKGEGR